MAPLTQPLIEPGADFTYEYVADEPAVAMYHPHAHGHMLLPNGMLGTILVGDVRLPLGRPSASSRSPPTSRSARRSPWC